MLKEWLANRRLEKVNRHVSNNPDKKLKVILDDDRAFFEIGDVKEGRNRYPLAHDGYSNVGIFLKGYVNELQFEADRQEEGEYPNFSEEVNIDNSRVIKEANLVDTESYKRFKTQEVISQALTPPDPSSLNGNGIPMWAIYAIIGILSVMTFALIAGGL